MNENIGDGLHLGVSIDNVKNQHITKYESEADQNGEGCLQKKVPLSSDLEDLGNFLRHSRLSFELQ